MSDNWIIFAIVLGGLGFGAACASLAYLRILINWMKTLHDDNVDAGKALVYADNNVTRKVEEQNMTQVTKRMDDLEEDK